MLPRVLIALAGAVVVTAALLLAMNEVTELFRERDPMRYFRITEFIPAPERRFQPVPPPRPERAPERSELEYQPVEPNVEVDRPMVDRRPTLGPDQPPTLTPELTPGQAPDQRTEIDPQDE